MNDSSIGFIGGGNMTRAIVGGLLAGGHSPEDICISEPDIDQRRRLEEDFAGVAVTADNSEIVTTADCVVLAVKPQVLAGVCRDLHQAAQAARPLVVSIAAGIRSRDIDAWLGGGLAVVRVMPNQPALLQKGVSGIYANPRTSESQRRRANDIMRAVGSVIEVADEADIDAVTAVSGSGPAYFYLLIEMLETGAREFGIDPGAARKLAIETATGAAALAALGDEPMADLIARVRSPGGTTAAALDALEAADIRGIFSQALSAARDRARQLADESSRSNA